MTNPPKMHRSHQRTAIISRESWVWIASYVVVAFIVGLVLSSGGESSIAGDTATPPTGKPETFAR
jgi:hypothetical protein